MGMTNQFSEFEGQGALLHSQRMQQIRNLFDRNGAGDSHPYWSGKGAIRSSRGVLAGTTKPA